MGISAIIAAYNEEKTIADVLGALTRNKWIDEVIVVSDGSTDATVDIARSFEITTIALRENRGKGYAMRLGVDYARHDILFFVDGDMLNLTDEHIESLLRPVLRGECHMNIGVRNRGPVRNFLHLQMKVGPVLSGIRVMRREVWDTVPLRYQERFKIEAALNFFCSQAGFRQQQTIIHNLGHLIKEEKRGLWPGLTSRWEMSREVFLLHWDLYVFATWTRDLAEQRTPVPQEYDLFE
ncbi:MAG TPA: glycosyltransferase family 2 protein [Thermoanaerobaculia bacterium]|nr:glycosyltransferase family 2 protein [Thermoanaerobaculia bacterium]